MRQRGWVPAISALLTFVVGCGGPVSFFPGGDLSGDTSVDPVEDWSFASDVLVGQPGELEGFDADRFIYRLDSARSQ